MDSLGKHYIVTYVAGIITALVLGCSVSSCVFLDNYVADPDAAVEKTEVDRGKIPDVDQPIKPPSLTNEWVDLNSE